VILSRCRTGFTLVEMIVAIALTGIVAGGAHHVVAGLIDGAERARRHRAEIDAETNGRVWLSSAVRSLDVQHGGFDGVADSMRFAAWLPTPSGWMERRQVVVALESDTLWLRTSDRAVPLRGGIQAVGIDYLLEPGLDAVFVKNWSSPVSAPLAVRMRLAMATGQADTLLLIVGDRG
jgi:prepilin-type N-terminal cleavage/methylation domain-containing protein